MHSHPEPQPQTSAHCYACGGALEPVFADHDADVAQQWDNALIVSLNGGYGMFIDLLDPATPDLQCGALHQPGQLSVVICHDCAHDLCDRVPWISKLIEPDTSHTHRDR